MSLLSWIVSLNNCFMILYDDLLSRSCAFSVNFVPKQAACSFLRWDDKSFLLFGSSLISSLFKVNFIISLNS